MTALTIEQLCCPGNTQLRKPTPPLSSPTSLLAAASSSRFTGPSSSKNAVSHSHPSKSVCFAATVYPQIVSSSDHGRSKPVIPQHALGIRQQQNPVQHHTNMPNVCSNLQFGTPNVLPNNGSHSAPSYPSAQTALQRYEPHTYCNEQNAQIQTQSQQLPGISAEDKVAVLRWGRTKAGKPRKRSGRACIRCQEKKIRCDWGGSSCTPCVRVSKQCRFTASNVEHDQTRRDNVRQQQKPLTNATERQGFDQQKDTPSGTQCHLPGQDDAAPEEHAFGIDVNPMLVDAELVKHYISTCEHVINCVFPPQSLTRWALDDRCKNNRSYILLYALLAFATALEPGQDHVHHTDIFIHIVYDGLNNVPIKYSLITVLTQFYLALAFHVQDRFREAYEVFGMVLLATNWLQLQTEVHKDFDEQPILNLSESSYRECRRRTFWMIFTTNTCIFSSQYQLAIFDTAGIFLRCLCISEEYAKDNVPETVLVDFAGCTDKFSLGCHVSLAVLHLVAICDEVRKGVRRAHAALEAGRQTLEAERLLSSDTRLKSWTHRWISQAKSNQQPGSADQSSWTYAEFLYSYAAMNFYRFRYHGKSTQREIAPHVRAVYRHAHRILELVAPLQTTSTESLECSLSAITSLITSYVVFEAVDVLSATVMVRDVICDDGPTMRLIYKGLEQLDRSAQYWTHARRQQSIAQKRSRVIFGAAMQAAMRRKVAVCCTHSMTEGITSSLDLVYSNDYKGSLHGTVAYQTALGEHDVEEIDTSDHAMYSNHV